MIPLSFKHTPELQPYEVIYQKMRDYTLTRTADTQDMLWLLEHCPVFTQGQAGKHEHLLDPGNIPVVQSDRGGQITYHGPGQLMIYTLFDLKRLGLGIKAFVQQLEQIIILLLKKYNIKAHTLCNAPGVYVNGAKICSLGLRVRHQRTYHGLSLNINMDLKPFSGINPCGFANLKMTQISDFVPKISVNEVANEIPPLFINQFNCRSKSSVEKL
ncbi:MAG: lipoyl(octanoyl) transferase LipB [Proteobacteria bacterium]|nr:lipoyl(octanoyl) transferase LipB [Pseudomonadota bacterium]